MFFVNTVSCYNEESATPHICQPEFYMDAEKILNFSASSRIRVLGKEYEIAHICQMFLHEDREDGEPVRIWGKEGLNFIFPLTFSG